MKKTKYKNLALASGFLIVAMLTVEAEEIAIDIISSKIASAEVPSLDLLLYLGEFQDRDGSLLEPEFFDESLKLKDDENMTKQSITQTKQEDDNETSQP